MQILLWCPDAPVCSRHAFCGNFKDPVVHVRLRWIMETLKHQPCTVGCVERLCRSWLSPWRATRISYRLYCPKEISPMGNSSAFPRGKPATQPTVHAGYFSVSIIHQTPTWAISSLTCAQMLMHATAHGGVIRHRKKVCTESRLWGEKSLAALGNRTCRSDMPVRRSTN